VKNNDLQSIEIKWTWTKAELKNQLKASEAKFVIEDNGIGG